MSDNITLPREVVKKAIKAFENGCSPTCENGMIDSGGFHPWGEPMLDSCPACLAFEHLRAALAAPSLAVTVDPRLTPDEAAAISSALAAPEPEPKACRFCNGKGCLRDIDTGGLLPCVCNPQEDKT